MIFDFSTKTKNYTNFESMVEIISTTKTKENVNSATAVPFAVAIAAGAAVVNEESDRVEEIVCFFLLFLLSFNNI